MKLFQVVVLFLTSLCNVNALDVRYPVSAIPDSLKSGMYAVVRDDNERFEIISRNKSALSVRHVITILNAKAKNYASMTIFYDKDTGITLFKATVYDAEGKEIRKLKQSEITDQSAISGYSLYEDGRIKHVDMSQPVYPYTVEFEVEYKFDFLYFIPDFTLFTDDEISIQNSTYTVTYPKALKPRFKLTHISEPARTNSGDQETVSWNFNNRKPEKVEPFSPPLAKRVPNIKAGPSDFEFGGYAGNMSTWKEYGMWQLLLNQHRSDLSQETKQMIRRLVEGLPTQEQKARAIYKFLQDKTRYVSIQLGIGGWQPLPASVVDKTSYGDCKALSNYMVALLNAADIKGYYTTIKAGRNVNDMAPDFSSNQSNHIIVAVPNGADTLWLECTSQTTPFGYLGTFTGDRYALLVAEDGGKIVRTVSYSAEQNRELTTATVDVDLAGNATAKTKTTYTGIQYEKGGLNFIMDNKFDEQKKWIQENVNIPTFTINTFSVTQKKNIIPEAIVKTDLTLNRMASVSEKRMFISPNLMNKISFTPQKTATRKNDIVLRTGYTQLDTIIYTFPQNLYPEFVPQSAKIDSRFGEYEAKYEFHEGKLIYIRKMKVWKGTFPKEAYQEFVDFYKKMSKSDNTKVVFLNKT